MMLSDDGDIPFYKPEVLFLDKALVMPGHSVVFWLIPVRDSCQEKSVPSVLQV